MNVTAQIIGTAVTVGGVIITGAAWLLKNTIATHITPVIVGLQAEAAALTREFQQFREVKEEERKETRAILRDLDAIVRNHELQLANHALRIDSLESPPPSAPAIRPRKRAA